MERNGDSFAIVEGCTGGELLTIKLREKTHSTWLRSQHDFEAHLQGRPNNCVASCRNHNTDTVSYTIPEAGDWYLTVDALGSDSWLTPAIDIQPVYSRSSAARVTWTRHSRRGSASVG